MELPRRAALRNLVLVCSFSPPAAAPPLILDTSITTFRTRIWEIKNPGLDSHMLFVGLSLFR